MATTVDVNERELRRICIQIVAQDMQQIRGPVDQGVRAAVDAAIKASPEHASLLDGDLQKLFGIANPSIATAAITKAVVDSVIVEIAEPVGDSFGGLCIYILVDDLSQVLNLDEASYESHSELRNTDLVVPWLSWLLLQGSQIVLVDWEVLPGERKGSRTGPIMISPTRRAPHGFAVPPEFSGVVDNNWLVRCLAEAAPAIVDVVRRQVEALR